MVDGIHHENFFEILQDHLMYAHYFMGHRSWSHEIIEARQHGAPEVGVVQPLEPSEFLVPQVDFAVQAFNPVV